MDTSEKYIEMCRKTYTVQHNKYKSGFNEADCVFDGENVRVVGHDFIHVQTIFRESDAHICRFAMTVPCSAVASIDIDPPKSIGIKCGMYRVEHIHNPIWIPRQDQLIELVTDNNCRGGVVKELIRFARFVEAGDGYWHSFDASYFPNPSLEQLTLAYVMNSAYSMFWNGSGWAGIPDNKMGA